MEIKTTISRTTDDLNESYAVALKNQGKSRSFWRMIIVLVFWVIMMISQNGLNFHNPKIIEWTLIVLLSMAFWYYFERNHGGKILKKNPQIATPETVTFDDHGVISETANSTSDSKWETYAKAIIGKETILLYPNNMVFFCYPKRCFSDQQFTALCVLVTEKIKDTKRIPRGTSATPSQPVYRSQ